MVLRFQVWLLYKIKTSHSTMREISAVLNHRKENGAIFVPTAARNYMQSATAQNMSFCA